VPRELDHLIKAIRLSNAPAGMKTRLIAIDGPGGAGKSSLANWLARELQAPIIHTDEFASWDNPIEWWPALLEKALKPIAAGQPARYEPTTWGGPREPQRVVMPAEFVIIEGVTALREAFRPYLAYSIWIETPREVRLRRGLERDGSEARDKWAGWMADEDAYIQRERPVDYADLVLPGDEGLWTLSRETDRLT
jgi:uridine kinase